MGRRLDRDDRGFTETFAVGVLLGVTLLMTLSVGIYVVAVDGGSGASDVSFTYEYDGDRDSLLVRHDSGEPLPSDDVLVTDGSGPLTWATIADVPANETVSEGDAALLTEGGHWGRPVTEDTEIRIFLNGSDDRTQLSNWSAE